MKPPRGYRKLKVGEMVEQGDRFYWMSRWNPSSATIGMPVGSRITYIRKVRKREL